MSLHDSAGLHITPERLQTFGLQSPTPPMDIHVIGEHGQGIMEHATQTAPKLLEENKGRHKHAARAQNLQQAHTHVSWK